MTEEESNDDDDVLVQHKPNWRSEGGMLYFINPL